MPSARRLARRKPAPTISDREPGRVYRKRVEDPVLGTVLLSWSGTEPRRAHWFNKATGTGGMCPPHYDPERFHQTLGHLL